MGTNTSSIALGFAKDSTIQVKNLNQSTSQRSTIRRYIIRLKRNFYEIPIICVSTNNFVR